METHLKNNWAVWLLAAVIAVITWAASSVSDTQPSHVRSAPVLHSVAEDHDHSGDVVGQIIDLSQWDFQRQGAAEVRDGWVVYRGELLSPNLFLRTGCQIPAENSHPHPVSLPDLWGPAITADIATGHGVATYCLELEPGNADQILGLRLGTLRAVSSVYAVYEDSDSKYGRIRKLYQNGDPLSEPREDAGNLTASAITLPQQTSRLKIIVQLANYVHKQGGMQDVPTVDYLENLNSRFRRDAALPTALFLILFTTATATLVAGRFRDDKMRYNIFALLSAASALRVLFVSDVIWDYFPSFPLARKYDLEYLSLFLVLAAYYAFIQMLFRGGKAKPFDFFVYGITGILSVFALFGSPFFPPGTITLVREPVQILWMIIAFVVAYTVIKDIIVEKGQKLDAALVLLAAVTMSSFEILSGVGLISYSMEWSQVLVLFVTVLHVRAFQLNYIKIERERDHLHSNLVEVNENLWEQAVDLKKALVLAEDSSRAKDEFLAAMSHELRTPLNAIIGFSEIMQSQMFGPVGDKRYKGYVDDIVDSGQNLLSTVNDILDVSRIESGADEMHEESIDLEGVAISAICLVSAQAAENDVSCRVEKEGELPLLYADERKVRQILSSLMNNAVKFNVSGGSVVLGIHYAEGKLSLSITDTGVGMSAKEIPIALTRFRQVDGDLNRRYEGLGLGLSLAQMLAEQHDAQLEIESEPGIGTTITVIFPETRTQVLQKYAVL